MSESDILLFMPTQTIPQLSFDDVIQKLRQEPQAPRTSYLAMYSTWYGGIIRDPQLMMVPVDDHMVHRGDAVFEAVKCLDRKVYGLDRHLERLGTSARGIGLELPFSLREIRDIALETVRVTAAETCMLRLYVSRGPGGFTANPYESLASQVYLVVTKFNPPAQRSYETGVSVKISSIQVKEGFFATVKSCNYLPNVLMKKESVDSGVDFTLSQDERGYLAEGSTENFAVISERGELLVPGFERTLRGITATRVMELAHALVDSGVVTGVRNAHLSIGDVAQAREAMMLGTTLDVLPVTRFEGEPVGDGKVGPVCKELLRVLREDMTSGPLVTDVPV